MKKISATLFQDFRALRLKFTSLLLILLLTLPVILLAQNRPVKFERIGLEQGLSQNSVYSILQDRQGFLWFGTQLGLNKFDGYTFTIYQHDIFDSTSISENAVCSIYEDHTGTLWAGTIGGGLNRFDRAKEQFTRFTHDPIIPLSLSHDVVYGIYEDRTATLWIATHGGLNRFDRAK